MAHGEYEGMTESDPKLRAMFTRESLLASDWYQERIRTQQILDTSLWMRHVEALDQFMSSGNRVPQIDIHERLTAAREQLTRVRSESYAGELVGTIGADPSVLAKR